MRVPVAKPTAAMAAVKKPRRRMSFGRAFRLFLFFLFIAVVVGVVFAFRSIPKRFNILVIGSDQRAVERGRSDVLMLVSIPKSPKTPITILTIPRDTRVEVPGFGTQKITHAYALGAKETNDTILGSRLLTKKTVEQFLNVPVDGTVEVTFKSFQDLIDHLGGVTTAKYGHINGEAALKIVRDRYREGGDFARTTDQRDILLDVMNEIRKQNAFQSTYDFLQKSQESRITIPKTRFALFAVYAIARRFGNVSLKGVKDEVVPGKGKMIYTADYKKNLYYWVPDVEGTRKIITEWYS